MMVSVGTFRRRAAVTAMVGLPAVAAVLWTANTATARPAPDVALKAAAFTSSASRSASLPTDRTVMIKAPKTKRGADRILTVHHDSAIVDFARSKPDKKYDLISNGKVWFGLHQVGPKEDLNYQIVSVRDTEGGDAKCLSMNSAGQVSEEACEEVERPGEIIIGRDVWHFEKHGSKYAIQGFAGYLQAHQREAGITKDRNTPPRKKFTIVVAPVPLPPPGE
jgi:hypothetical protein